MKKKKIFLSLLVTLFFACSEKQSESIPDTILPKEMMVNVLVDVHLLEASLNLNTNPTMIASAGTPISIDVLKKNNITKLQYDESFNYYSQHPKLLSEVYEAVLTTLSKMQAEAMKAK